MYTNTYFGDLVDTSDDEDMSSDASDSCTEQMSSSSSDSSSSDSNTFRRKLNRVTSFLKTVDAYDENEFRENLRLNRSTCNKIIEIVEEKNILPSHSYGRKKISAKKSVYITLWYLSNTNSYREVSNLFNVTKSSVYRVITKIVNFLVAESPKYIKWPSNEEITEIKEGFKSKQGIDGIIGAIDGCHINIRRPNSEHKHAYCNRKGEFSILLQGVCDHNKKFLDIFCGEPGSLHDARLLKKSSLYEKAINGLMRNDFLLGDSAYPCLLWLIPPFKDNGCLNEQQRIFNFKHSSSRIVIENAYGLLKSRFRRLKKFENEDLVFVSKCVVAAAVLHNICIDCNDEILEESIEENREAAEDRNAVNDIIPACTSKRTEIFNKMFNIIN